MNKIWLHVRSGTQCWTGRSTANGIGQQQSNPRHTTTVFCFMLLPWLFVPVGHPATFNKNNPNFWHIALAIRGLYYTHERHTHPDCIHKYIQNKLLCMWWWSVSCNIEVSSVGTRSKLKPLPAPSLCAASPFQKYYLRVCVCSAHPYRTTVIHTAPSIVLFLFLSDPNRIYVLDIYCYDYYYGILGDKFDFGFRRFSCSPRPSPSHCFSFFWWLCAGCLHAYTYVYTHCYSRILEKWLHAIHTRLYRFLDMKFGERTGRKSSRKRK